MVKVYKDMEPAQRGEFLAKVLVAVPFVRNFHHDLLDRDTTGMRRFHVDKPDVKECKQEIAKIVAVLREHKIQTTTDDFGYWLRQTLGFSPEMVNAVSEETAWMTWEGMS